MGKDYDLTITVNFPDGREAELSAVGHTQFEKLAEMVQFALLANGVKEDDWSSLVVSIVSPNLLAHAPKPKPALRVV